MNPERTFLVAKRLIAEYSGLTPIAIKGLQKLFIEKINQRAALKWFYENYDISTEEKLWDMAREKNILMDLMTWEQVLSGFSELY